MLAMAFWIKSATFDFVVFDEDLLHQADFLVELFHSTGSDALGDFGLLAFGDGFLLIDFHLGRYDVSRNIFLLDVLRGRGGDLQVPDRVPEP